MRSDFEHIYNVSLGFEEPKPFEKPSRILMRRYDLLYEITYAAREKIARHIGGSMDDESADVLALISTYEKMMYTLCKYFYDYGRAAGNSEQAKGYGLPSGDRPVCDCAKVRRS